MHTIIFGQNAEMYFESYWMLRIFVGAGSQVDQATCWIPKLHKVVNVFNVRSHMLQHVTHCEVSKETQLVIYPVVICTSTQTGCCTELQSVTSIHAIVVAIPRIIWALRPESR